MYYIIKETRNYKGQIMNQSFEKFKEFQLKIEAIKKIKKLENKELKKTKKNINLYYLFTEELWAQILNKKIDLSQMRTENINLITDFFLERSQYV